MSKSEVKRRRRWMYVATSLSILVVAGLVLLQALPAFALHQARDTTRALLGADFDARDVTISPSGAVVFADARLTNADGTETVEFESIEIRPSKWHGLVGKHRIDLLRVAGVRLDSHRLTSARRDTHEHPAVETEAACAADAASRVRSAFRRVRTLNALLTRHGTIEFQDIRIDHPDASTGTIVIDRVRLERRRGNALRATGTIRDGDGRIRWDLDLEPARDRAQGDLEIVALPMSALAALVPEVPWHEEDHASIDGRLTLRALQPGQPAAIEGDLQLRDLWLASERLAEDPVGPLNVAVQGEGTWSFDEHVLRIETASAELNGTAITFDGTLRPSSERYLVDLELALDRTECNALFASMPAAVLEPYAGFSWDGSLGGRAVLSLDASDLDATRFDVELDNACSFVRAPAEVHVSRFAGPFVHTAPAADGGELAFITGPGTDRWVPLERVSPFLIHAVLAHEDAGFFRHRGFAPYAIEDALEKNLERGRFAYGASTVSMQLAKNLFLTRDKTVARKLREIVLTWWLEERLSKREILELYLNVIEYGPDVYGIGEASRRYFRSVPGDLTLAQSAYLATVLPAPSSYHRIDFQASRLSDRTAGRVAFLIRHMAKRGRIAEDARDRALGELARFSFSRSRETWVAGDTAPLPIDQWPVSRSAERPDLVSKRRSPR